MTTFSTTSISIMTIITIIIFNVRGIFGQTQYNNIQHTLNVFIVRVVMMIGVLNVVAP
jgi:hypothetical protein